MSNLVKIAKSLELLAKLKPGVYDKALGSILQVLDKMHPELSRNEKVTIARDLLNMLRSQHPRRDKVLKFWDRIKTRKSEI